MGKLSQCLMFTYTTLKHIIQSLNNINKYSRENLCDALEKHEQLTFPCFVVLKVCVI